MYLKFYKILQNDHIEIIDEGVEYINKNLYINRFEEELYTICILWKEEYIHLTLVLTEIEQKNEFHNIKNGT